MDETTGGQVVPCTVCGGSGQIKLLDQYMPVLPCRNCGGSGRVTVEQARWEAEGRLLCGTRRGLRLGMQKVAERLELSTRQVAEAEQGKMDPADVGYTLETLILCARKSD